MRNLELKIIQKCIFTMQDLFIADWGFKDLRKTIEKGVVTLRSHFRRKNVWNVLCKEAEMIGEVLFLVHLGIAMRRILMLLGFH